MAESRKKYRPSEVNPLEDRLVLSTVSAIEASSVLRPVVTVSREGTVKALVETKGASRKNALTFTTTILNKPAAADGIATISVQYANNTSTPITSATILDKLSPALTYYYGGETPVDGVLSGAVAANGSQEVELTFPYGIAPGGQGTWTFQVGARTS